ncbi:MAG: Rdx family protein [Terriglobales bacterium]
MRLKKSLEAELGTPVGVRNGSPGSLNVFLDGQRIFSKQESGRFPRAEELLARIRQKPLPS